MKGLQIDIAQGINHIRIGKDFSFFGFQHTPKLDFDDDWTDGHVTIRFGETLSSLIQRSVMLEIESAVPDQPNGFKTFPQWVLEQYYKTNHEKHPFWAITLGPNFDVNLLYRTTQVVGLRTVHIPDLWKVFQLDRGLDGRFHLAMVNVVDISESIQRIVDIFFKNAQVSRGTLAVNQVSPIEKPATPVTGVVGSDRVAVDGRPSVSDIVDLDYLKSLGFGIDPGVEETNHVRMGLTGNRYLIVCNPTSPFDMSLYLVVGRGFHSIALYKAEDRRVLTKDKLGFLLAFFEDQILR